MTTHSPLLGFLSRGVAPAVLLLATALAGAGAGRVTPAAAQTPYVPLFRLANYQTGDHFYTTDGNEAANAVQNLGYMYEGITGYIMSSRGPGTVPLIRLVNRDIGHHFYTTSYPEVVNAVKSRGFEYEGVAAWIIASPLEITLATSKELYTVGERVNFEIVARNRGTSPITLHFGSGQTYEIVVWTLDGAVVWESSTGRRYTQALMDITIAPGKEERWSDSWDQRSIQAILTGTRTLADPGVYQAVAQLTINSQYRPLSNPVGFSLQ